MYHAFNPSVALGKGPNVAELMADFHFRAPIGRASKMVAERLRANARLLSSIVRVL